MFLPIGDDQVRGGHRPFFAYGFILLNILIFLYEASMAPAQLESFVTEYGSIPIEIERGQDLYTLFTSMFLHGSWLHLGGNMLYMWIFADNIEATVGSTVFVIFYFLGGLAAHAGHILANPASTIPTVGASGALSAVLGAYLVMFPASRVRGYLFLFHLRVPAVAFLLIWIAQQVLSGYQSLSIEGQATGVAWWAHIGGFVFGVAAGLYFRRRFYIPVASTGFQARPQENNRDDRGNQRGRYL